MPGLAKPFLRAFQKRIELVIFWRGLHLFRLDCLGPGLRFRWQVRQRLRLRDRLALLRLRAWWRRRARWPR